MKLNRNDIQSEIIVCSSNLSILATMADYEIDWSKIPNSKLEILRDRIVLMRKSISDIFQIIDNYEK